MPQMFVFNSFTQMNNLVDFLVSVIFRHLQSLYYVKCSYTWVLVQLLYRDMYFTVSFLCHGSDVSCDLKVRRTKILGCS